VLTTTCAALSMGVFSEPAMADDSGFYIGANIGRVLSTYRRSDLDAALSAGFGGANSGFVLGSSSLHKAHAMWSADIGYMLSPNVGIEASYIDLGTLKYSAAATQPSTSGTGSAPVTVNVDIKSRGPALALIGVLPMSNSWELDARAGAYEGKTISTFRSVLQTTNNFGTESKTSTSLLAGFGGSLTLTSHCTVRLDYLRLQHLNEQVFGRSFNVDLVTAGMNFVF
jgi:opacity protein-like surface antigen